MTRSLLIIGNWKLNGNSNTITNLLVDLTKKLVNISTCQIAIAPPIVYLGIAKHYLINSNIKLCAQNVDVHLSGAFTGDISAEMLQDLNTRYVLIGHAERRIYHKENDLYIAKKFSILKEIGLTPVLCIGENKKEHDSGDTKLICMKQLDIIIKLFGPKALENTVIAYEPIWAIGNHTSALPEDVQLIHKFIREYIALYDTHIAKTILIQYGGSINPNNVAHFIAQEDIDGVLVGSASLNANQFTSIINIATKTIKHTPPQPN